MITPFAKTNIKMMMYKNVAKNVGFHPIFQNIFPIIPILFDKSQNTNPKFCIINDVDRNFIFRR